MKQEVKLKGQLKFYIQWPLFMTVLLIVMNVWVFCTDRRAGIVMAVFVLIYIVIACAMYFYSKSRVLSDLMDFAAQYGIVQNLLLRDLSVPYAILLPDGRILWTNSEFDEVLGGRHKKDSYLSRYIPELSPSVFPKNEEDSFSIEFDLDEGSYRAELRCISVKNLSEDEQVLELPPEQENFITVYLQDVTEINHYIQENEEQRLVAGLIYIDNYDEVMESVEEVRQSLLVALIDRKINQYVANRSGIVKKLEKDKYFIVIKKRDFMSMREDRFSLLEDVKSISIGNQVPPTLSIGLGLTTDTYVSGYNYARVAVDLALARGGDQAVVKSGEGITYFGGKREQSTRYTRVKARVKAEALGEFIAGKERIVVQGHQMPDPDSFGAAIGVCRAAQVKGKKAHIVLNEVNMSVRPFFEAFKKSPACPEDLFISSEQAKSLVDENTMLVVVDTNKPRMTECEQLLRQTKTIAVFDHHRQSDEVIENAVLTYIEPYASSACEMVAEMLQYLEEDLRLNSMEANCLYAGIMVDTNTFTTRTGVRTFEAAAYLRRCGADISYVRKLLREDMASYRAKAALISSTEVYRKVYAIARGSELHVESPNIVGAQAANELLDIEEIKASFVLTEYNHKIYISARSIDEVNVQIIMERMGGGGHINMAGAQLENTSLDQAVERLKKTLDIMKEKGDI